MNSFAYVIQEHVYLYTLAKNRYDQNSLQKGMYFEYAYFLAHISGNVKSLHFFKMSLYSAMVGEKGCIVI